MQPYSDELATRKRKRLPPAAPIAGLSPANNYAHAPPTTAAIPGHPPHMSPASTAASTSLEALRRMMQQMQMSQAQQPVQHGPPPVAQPPPQAFAPATVQELPYDEALSAASAENSMKSSVPSSPANPSTLSSSSMRINGGHAYIAQSQTSPPPDPKTNTSRSINDIDMPFLQTISTANGLPSHQDPLGLEHVMVDGNFAKDTSVSPLWMDPVDRKTLHESGNNTSQNGTSVMDTDLQVKAEAIEEFMDLPDDLELLPPLTTLPDGTDMSALARQIQGFTDAKDSSMSPKSGEESAMKGDAPAAPAAPVAPAAPAAPVAPAAPAAAGSSIAPCEIFGGNLYDFTEGKDGSPEKVETLFRKENVLIERIVSYGGATDWYDQDTIEFVSLLQGSARLQFEGEERERILMPGAYIYIPKHKRHRVTHTEQGAATMQSFIIAHVAAAMIAFIHSYVFGARVWTSVSVSEYCGLMSGNKRVHGCAGFATSASVDVRQINLRRARW
eukprot:IDg12514t1